MGMLSTQVVSSPMHYARLKIDVIPARKVFHDRDVRGKGLGLGVRFWLLSRQQRVAVALPLALSPHSGPAL